MEQRDDGRSVFQTKYEEFAKELLMVFPEQSHQIQTALALDEKARIEKFRDIGCVSEYTNDTANPGTILPGVVLTNDIWNILSETNKKTIWEYVRLLSMCYFLEGMFGEKIEKPAWINDTIRDWGRRLEKVDFESIIGKFANIFIPPTTPQQTTMPEQGTPPPPAAFPKLPERFLKGQLAKLSVEIIQLIKPEDLGITPELIKECETTPSRAFEILIQAISRNPGIIQNTIQRIGKTLQKKVQNGQIRPQEIAQEAEELIKEFANMPEFVDIMSSFKSAFGMEDPDLARQVGREASARMSIVKQRLRNKLDVKKQNKGR